MRRLDAGGSESVRVLLEWCFPGRSLWKLGRKPFMFNVVEGFHGQIRAIQWFRAARRGQKIDIVLGFVLRCEPAETILGHMRRRVPKGESDRASLKHSQATVPNLESSRACGGAVEDHFFSHV